jgi:hypothetical protein
MSHLITTLDWSSLAVGGLIGFVLNVAASYVYDKLRVVLSKRKVKIDGLWAEYLPESSDHQYTFGRIYFDKARGFYAFDGTNYRNDGQPFCHFQTVTSHIDLDTHEYFYVFVAQVENELDRRYYGFGVVNLTVDDKGALVPARGHYVSANVDGKPMSHTIVPADELGSAPNGAAVITFLGQNRQSH